VGVNELLQGGKKQASVFLEPGSARMTAALLNGGRAGSGFPARETQQPMPFDIAARARLFIVA